MMLFSKTNLKSSKKIIIIIIFIIIITVILTWLFIESSKPLPGQKMLDLGREHIETGKEVKYNSDPPTSGPHYGDWVRAEVYDTQKDDRNLVHSLEHGYIVMSYKCKMDNGQLTMDNATKSAQASPSGELDTEEQCDQRKDQLAKIYEKKGKRKLIVVPRANLDTNFALTAWAYLDKFDTFDGQRIIKFIDAHRDMGPERTME